MTDEIRNPCDWKNVCKNCKLVEMTDRPGGCKRIECQMYTPCITCNQNRKLNIENKCVICVMREQDVKAKEQRKRLSDVKQVMKDITAVEITDEEVEQSNQQFDDYILTPPGTPPEELNVSEKKYYNDRWSDYEEYYRDPAASAIIHFIILQEIQLLRIDYFIFASKGALHGDYLKEKQDSLRLLTELKKQLPDKEASEETDDEKSIAMIRERYLEEAAANKIGSGLLKVFSEEAIALAPELPSKIDPKELLERCGYSIVSIEQALEKYELYKGRTPEEMLELMGFKLKERYAMPYDPSLADAEFNAVKDEINAEIPVSQ